MGKVERFPPHPQSRVGLSPPLPVQHEHADAFQAWLDFYNHRRPHSALDGLTPMAVLVNNAHEKHT